MVVSGAAAHPSNWTRLRCSKCPHSTRKIFLGKLSCPSPDHKKTDPLKCLRQIQNQGHRSLICAGCLVVITDHGPRAEAAQALGHELLVDNGEGRLEGLEEERQKREEKEVGEERERANTTHG